MTCPTQFIILHDQLIRNIGNLVGAVVTGGVITSGIVSIFFLSTKHRMRRQNRYLRIYVILLILLVLAYDVLNIILSQVDYIFCFRTEQEFFAMLVNFERATMVLIVAVGALTDGILVRSV
jgi:hypothetical protein